MAREQQRVQQHRQQMRQLEQQRREEQLEGGVNPTVVPGKVLFARRRRQEDVAWLIRASGLPDGRQTSATTDGTSNSVEMSGGFSRHLNRTPRYTLLMNIPRNDICAWLTQ